MYQLAIDHLTKRYGPSTVVDGLSFTVEPGRVTGFLGPNGSGKSTTMKILLGLASANAGRATIGGFAYRDLPAPARSVGAVLEPNAFHPGRSGRNHLRILASAAGIAPGRVDEVLETMGLGGSVADRRAGAYSLGMKQRLSLAGALLGNPPVLVLDEPGNGLDPQGMRALRDLLRARAAEGHTVFVSSHLLAEIEHLADDLIVLHRGRLVTSGSVSELRQTASLVRSAESALLRQVIEGAGGTAQAQGPDVLLVRGMPIEEIGKYAFGAGITLHELSPHSNSLEEMFLAWTDDSRAGTTEPELEEIHS